MPLGGKADTHQGLSPEYFVVLLPVNVAVTNIDWLFNIYFVFFHPESDCFTWTFICISFNISNINHFC
jgi:hypothetical protein